jgi:hypothetical protein
MLDTLLVLGQVPGTDFYITFSEVLLFFVGKKSVTAVRSGIKLNGSATESA